MCISHTHKIKVVELIPDHGGKYLLAKSTQIKVHL